MHLKNNKMGQKDGRERNFEEYKVALGDPGSCGGWRDVQRFGVKNWWMVTRIRTHGEGFKESQGSNHVVALLLLMMRNLR